MNHRHRAFALRDLLVCIILVAVVTTLIVPTLTHARSRAREKSCLRNVGAIARAALAYAADDAQGHFPPSPEWANARCSMEVYSRDNNSGCLEEYFPHGGSIGYNNPWFGMGLLYGEGYINDPQTFFCPDRRDDMFSWPQGWGDEYSRWRYTSYLYRIFGQPWPYSNPAITPDDILELWHLPAGDASEALFADVFNLCFYTELVHTNPFGVNVSFADGHARWMHLGEKERSRCERQAMDNSIAGKDVFTWMYFKALSTRDFTPLDAAGFTADPGNPLDAWIAACCTLDPAAWTRSSVLYRSYTNWALKNASSHHRMRRRQFVQALGWLDAVQRERRGRDGFKGIALKAK